MHSVLRAVVAALTLLPAASASAALPASVMSGPYACQETFANYGPTGMPSWNVADRGTLDFNSDYDVGTDTTTATSYDYDAFFLTQQARAGGWSWDGHRALFDSGPLARPAEGWSVEALYRGGFAERRMPHDPQPGRTFPIVLRSLIDDPAEEAPATAGKEGQDAYQSTYWYCGPHGTAPRKAIGGLAGYVAREAKVPVRLPLWIQTRGAPDRLTGQVKVLRRGYYRVKLVTKGCKGSACSDWGIFSAKRAPASELGHRTRVDLGRGVVGWYGNYGCAYHGSDPDWGPTYCGVTAIVWHQDGVNYAIESRYADDASLVRAARQSVAERRANAG